MSYLENFITVLSLIVSETVIIHSSGPQGAEQPNLTFANIKMFDGHSLSFLFVCTRQLAQWETLSPVHYIIPVGNPFYWATSGKRITKLSEQGEVLSVTIL